VDWYRWRNDYALVRGEIAKTYPDTFHDFNERMWTPGGFPRNLPARKRKWQTKSGKAEFSVPETLGEDPDMPEREPQSLRLMTLRSDSQFNTTIYSLDDRFRGIKGDRIVIFMCEADMTRHGLQKNDRITLRTIADDGFERRVAGLRRQPYDIPQGCIAGYYPECNPLLPLWHYAKGSKVPGAKSIPVLIVEVNGRLREA
jgi:anaerobic selenocysteine-containing dehydrogenase